MSDVRTEEFSEPRLNINLRVSDNAQGGDVARNDTMTRDASDESGTPDESAQGDAKQSHKGAAGGGEHEPTTSKLSMVKVEKQNRLPALDDDSEVGVQKEQIVTRDGKADLRFNGVLLASAAPTSTPKGRWQEYWIYQTTGDRHVFSKITRSVREDASDTHEADVFDPSPSSVPSQLMRSARELAMARPLTWMDAAVAFFGYDPLAKVLYRKLSVRFEEQIS